MFKPVKRSLCCDAQQCKSLFLEYCLQHHMKLLHFLYKPWVEDTPLGVSVRFVLGYYLATRDCWSKKQHFKSASYAYYCGWKDYVTLAIPISEIFGFFWSLNNPFLRWTGATCVLQELCHYSRYLSNCAMSLQWIQSPCFLESPTIVGRWEQEYALFSQGTVRLITKSK